MATYIIATVRIPTSDQLFVIASWLADHLWHDAGITGVCTVCTYIQIQANLIYARIRMRYLLNHFCVREFILRKVKFRLKDYERSNELNVLLSANCPLAF